MSKTVTGGGKDFENGVRIIINIDHVIGHALEKTILDDRTPDILLAVDAVRIRNQEAIPTRLMHYPATLKTGRVSRMPAESQAGGRVNIIRPPRSCGSDE